MKYGSAGFHSWGYQGGCEFLNGPVATALAAPAAAQYLCPSSLVNNLECMHDFSGAGLCRDASDGYNRITAVRLPSAKDICTWGAAFRAVLGTGVALVTGSQPLAACTFTDSIVWKSGCGGSCCDSLQIRNLPLNAL